MMTYPADTERRRSRRTRLSVPLLVWSLDSTFAFCKHLSTVEVNDHGCLISVPRPFPHGTRLHLNLLHSDYSDHSTTASVIRSIPAQTHVKFWNVALELDKPGKFWRVTSLS